MTQEGNPGARTAAPMLLVLSVAAVLAYGYLVRIDLPFYADRLEMHQQILAGTAESPFNYRVLVPFAVEGARRLLATSISDTAAFVFAYALYELIAIFLVLALLLVWLRHWFTAEQALVGALFVGGTMQIALQDHYFQPTSLLEPALFAAGLVAIERRRDTWLAVLVVLASLNRETGVFLALAFLVARAPGLRRAGPERGRVLAFAAVLLLLWAGVFFGVRLVRGDVPRGITVAETFARNTSATGLLFACIQAPLFLGALWVFAALGFRSAPALVQRLAALVPLYLATVLVWGIWSEVRLLMPLYPLLVPLGLAYVYPARPPSTQSEGEIL